MGLQTHFEELPLHQRAIAKTCCANVGIAMVEQRAGPVIVPCRNIACINLPENLSRFGIEGIPVIITAANVNHSILHCCSRCNARYRRIALRSEEHTSELQS